MTKQQDILVRLSSLALLAGVAFFCWWIFRQNFPASRQIVLSVPFDENRAMISRLLPESCARVDGSGAVISCDSVYFTVRSPAWFGQARLVINYRPDQRQLRGVAWRTDSAEDFSETHQWLSDYEIAGGLRQAVAVLDLRSKSAQDSLRTFAIMTAGQADQSVFIDKISLTMNY